MREQREQQQQQDLDKTTNGQPQEPELKGEGPMTMQTEDAATGSAARDASRELDALIAEKVMGYHVERVTPEWYGGTEVMLFFRPGSDLIAYSCDSCNAMMFRNGVDDKQGIADVLPSYSDDLTAAWEVVEKLRVDGWCLSLHEEGQKSNQWVADFVDAEDDLNYTGEELAPTAPLAICRAALLVVGAA